MEGNNNNRSNLELFSSKEFSPKEFVRRIFTESIPSPSKDSNPLLVMSKSQNWDRSVGNIHSSNNNANINALENLRIHGSFSTNNGIQITNKIESKQVENIVSEENEIKSNTNEPGYISYEELIFDEDVRTHKLYLDEYYSQVQNSTLNHVYNIKMRLLKKYEMEISDLNSQHNEQIEMNDSKIQMLTEQLNECQLTNNNKITHLEAACLKLCMSYGKKCGLLVSTKFILKIINSWKRYSLENKRLRQLGKLTIKMLQKSKQRKFFTIWTKVQVQYYIYEIRKEAKSRLEMTTKSMVEKYELELKRVKSELSDAHTAVRQEQLRRHQIEEDLRRMFLKNMTVMNMEALTLFQPPQPPQSVTSTAITSTNVASKTMNPIIMDNAPHRRSKPTIASSSQVKTKSVPVVVATASVSTSQSRGPPPPHTSLVRSVKTTSKTSIDDQLRQQQEQRFQQLQRQQEQQQQQLDDNQQLEQFQQQQRMIKLRSQTQSNRQILIEQQQQHQQQQQQHRQTNEFQQVQLSHSSQDNNQNQIENSLLLNQHYRPSSSSSSSNIAYFRGINDSSSVSPPHTTTSTTTTTTSSSSIFNLTSPGSNLNRVLSHDSEEVVVDKEDEVEEEEEAADQDEEFPRELPPPLHLYTQQGGEYS